MAGFWIPWEIGLTSKREVLIISKSIGVSRREAAAICMEVWGWAQEQTIDGLIAGMNVADLSSIIGVEGIGEAMKAVGWIVESDNCLQFPNWDRFNSLPAKKRLSNAERQRKFKKQHRHL